MKRLTTPFIASLALGLAPLVPEPHLLGKLRWVAGGAVGMQSTDWFDLAMHGAPVLWLLGTAVVVLLERLRPTPAPGTTPVTPPAPPLESKPRA